MAITPSYSANCAKSTLEHALYESGIQCPTIQVKAILTDPIMTMDDIHLEKRHYHPRLLFRMLLRNVATSTITKTFNDMVNGPRALT